MSIARISIGLVKLISQNSMEKLGGAAVKKVKKQLGVSMENMRSKMMMRIYSTEGMMN